MEWYGYVLLVAGLLIVAFIFFLIGMLYRKKVAEREIGSAETEATRIINEAIKGGENKKREMLVEAKEEIHKSRTEYEKEVKERRADLQKQERRLQQKEESLDKKLDAFERKEDDLRRRQANIAATQDEVEMIKKSQLETLEKLSGLTQEEAAARVGKSRPAVANALRLLLLPEEVRSLVEDGTISAGHARAILSLPAARLQKAAAQKIVALRLSVRQAEAMCKRMLQEEEKPEPKPAPLTVDYVAECEKSLTRRLDRKVRIVNGKRKGRFELEFYGQEDLQRLYDALLALGKTEETPECLN